ncbi:hypothetical protein DCO57_16475 [Labrenzia sp. 011]|nr:hypothetical protein DCO57_16475 [Labrenzia sp. 011]
MIGLDGPGRERRLEFCEEELARRLEEWISSHQVADSGYARLFRDRVQGADTGAGFDFLKGCRRFAVPKDSH